MGRPVRIVSIVDTVSLSGDAGTNAMIARKSRIEIRHVETQQAIEESIADASTLVDALLGTGATGSPRGRFADMIREANRHAGEKIAIDVPTGLDCDSGLANDPTFRADHTITFVSRKVGFERDNAEAYVGVVYETGIGIPQCLMQDILTW
jgi:NAD(P)H-hydrate epimerase